jgi:trafficking protein particle complex subunit 9
LFFNFMATAPTEAQLALTPFELFREPTIILGVGDAQEYPQSESTTFHSERNQTFLGFANELRSRHPRTLLHRVLLFDEVDVEKVGSVEDDLLLLPRSNQGYGEIKAALEEIAISLLVEWSSYAKSIQSLPSIASPTVPQNQSLQAQWFGDESHTSSRPISQMNSSPHGSSPILTSKDVHRLSMPVLSSSLSNGSDSALRMGSPVSGKPPAKTFDEMADAQLGGSNPALDKLKPRSGSLVPSRQASQDRIQVQGFGSASFSEKTRDKGKGRVGAVLSSVYLLAGRWPDALKQSVESAHKARSYSDHVWHAKSLEIIVISMLLLAWAGIDFGVCNVEDDLNLRLIVLDTANMHSERRSGIYGHAWIGGN